MSFTRNTRLHPNAIIPVAEHFVETTEGSVPLTVPTGASGIMFQQIGGNDAYWSVDGEMSNPGEGFKISTFREVFWFSPSHVQTIYLYLESGNYVVYQFVAPVAY